MVHILTTVPDSNILANIEDGSEVSVPLLIITTTTTTTTTTVIIIIPILYQ